MIKDEDSSSIDAGALHDDFLFDPIDGTFVLKISAEEEPGSGIDCSAGINDRGYRDSVALLVTLTLITAFLLLLLYINGTSSTSK